MAKYLVSIQILHGQSSLGCFYSDGLYRMPQNHAKALELYHLAAKLGNASPHYSIGMAYYNGSRGVERDEKRLCIIGS